MINVSHLLEARRRVNWQQMKYFIAAMAGLAGLVVAFHSSRKIGRWLRARNKGPLQPRTLIALSRNSRRVLLRKVPLLPSGGHVVIISCYLAINFALFFSNTDFQPFSKVSNYAARAGWLALGNLVILIFLALKNTPLAFITSWSYERLNIFHRVAGYMTVVFVLIHGACYLATHVIQKRVSQLAEPSNVYGEVAGLSMLLMGLTGAFMRRRSYELFYIIHVVLWMLAAVTVSLHQPKLQRKALIVVLVTAGMWILDRLIRGVRLLVYSANNFVRLDALPHGATRVTINKTPLGTVSGKHCFLWIPKICTFEMHPFTIAAAGPLELIISSHDGFTRKLHQYALAHPGATLFASVEGPFGFTPCRKEYDCVLLVAAGSGATLTVGIALDMLSKLERDETKRIIFVWIMKYDSQLSWFASHLDTLSRDDRVSLHLYITRSSPPETPTTLNSFIDLKPPTSTITTRFWDRFTDSEKSLPSSTTTGTPSSSSSETSFGTPTNTTTAHHDDLAAAYHESIHRGRPSVPSLVRAAIDEAAGTPEPDRRRILVVGCGPDSFMNDVRNTTAACIRTDGPGIELVTHQFGW